MTYLDTSFLVPFYLKEATSKQVISIFVASTPGEFAISSFVSVEFASLLSRRKRMGELKQGILETIVNTFQKEVDESFSVLVPSQADYALASSFILRQGSSLRGPDALHLAVAANSGADAIYSLDVKLIEEANALGLSASDGGVGSG